jgi:hypothetical protein
MTLHPSLAYWQALIWQKITGLRPLGVNPGVISVSLFPRERMAAMTWLRFFFVNTSATGGRVADLAEDVRPG